MDFYVDVNGTVYPDTDGMDKVKRDIAALFEDDCFGSNLHETVFLTDERKEKMKTYLSKYIWDYLPKDLQGKVGRPTIILNEDGTYTFKFYLRTAI